MQAKFIKLTSANTVYRVNVSTIRLYTAYQNATIVRFVDGLQSIFVQETPEQIDQLIAELEPTITGAVPVSFSKSETPLSRMTDDELTSINELIKKRDITYSDLRSILLTYNLNGYGLIPESSLKVIRQIQEDIRTETLNRPLRKPAFINKTTQ